MALYNVCFCISDVIEAEDKTEALEMLASYIKDMRLSEIDSNTTIEEKPKPENDDEEDKTSAWDGVVTHTTIPTYRTGWDGRYSTTEDVTG